MDLMIIIYNIFLYINFYAIIKINLKAYYFNKNKIKIKIKYYKTDIIHINK